MIAIELAGKRAVVTGGSGELGRVIVRTLARAGAEVAIGYLRGRERAERLRDEVAAGGARALAAPVDVTDEDSVLRFRGAVGEADIVVNAAVIQYGWTTVLEQAAEDYEGQFRSCVLHNVLMAKAFVPGMLERGWGRIIALSTECAMQCHPKQSAYVAGKRGMDGVLRVLAREVGGGGVTVNQVAPGWTVSESRRESDDDLNRWYRGQVPLGRRGRDQEIANVVAFLASDLASFITGAYIPVCGGNVMPAI